MKLRGGGGGEGVEVSQREVRAHELRMAPAARAPNRFGVHRARVQGHHRVAVQGAGHALAVQERDLLERVAHPDAQRGETRANGARNAADGGFNGG